VIRILLCGEGPHDVGLQEWDPRSRRHVIREGWLQNLARQLTDEPVEFLSCMRKELVLLPRQAKRPLPRGHGEKALAALIRGQSERCDVVVFMLDADSPDRVVWERKRSEIYDGFTRFPAIRGVACVPKSASESWLLADPNAWLQVGLPDTRTLPQYPEEIWGVHNDPASNRPHNYFARMCQQAGQTDSRETRALLAIVSATEALGEKCPISFRGFADDFRAAI
jgi:hypothetical protein